MCEVKDRKGSAFSVVKLGVVRDRRTGQADEPLIDAGVPVGLQLDCYYLDYFTHKVHFGAHYVAMHGYDDRYAYLVDTAQQGSRVKATHENVALARSAKGRMTSRNLSYTMAKVDGDLDLGEAALRAIRANAEDFLNPPIKNTGYKGIEKAAREVRKWLGRSERPEEDLALAAVLMERGGTGGALFRNMYKDFLGECVALVGGEELGRRADRLLQAPRPAPPSSSSPTRSINSRIYNLTSFGRSL